jgi:hypothetical protein
MDGVRQLTEKHDNKTTNTGQIIMRYDEGSTELQCVRASKAEQSTKGVQFLLPCENHYLPCRNRSLIRFTDACWKVGVAVLFANIPEK